MYVCDKRHWFLISCVVLLSSSSIIVNAFLNGGGITTATKTKVQQPIISSVSSSVISILSYHTNVSSKCSRTTIRRPIVRMMREVPNEILQSNNGTKTQISEFSVDCGILWICLLWMANDIGFHIPHAQNESTSPTKKSDLQNQSIYEYAVGPMLE